MIGHDLAADLEHLRVQFESLAWDRCRVDRAATGWDEAQKKSVTTWRVIHDDVPCQVEESPAMARQTLTDEAVTRQHPVVRIPVRFGGIEPDDRVTITYVHPQSGATLGAVLWVTHARMKTNSVKRRIECRWLR